MTIQVTATANGYYGKKVRVPGEKFAIDSADDFSEIWMTKEKVSPVERFVATGGTDGVVGTTVLVDDPRDRSAKDKKDREMAGISDNDDRSRDVASVAGNDAPLPDASPVSAFDHDRNGKDGGSLPKSKR